MRVFVYESLTAGSLDEEANSPPEPSLLREGAAMLAALVADLADTEQAHVTALVNEQAASALPTSLRQHLHRVNMR